MMEYIFDVILKSVILSLISGGVFTVLIIMYQIIINVIN